METKLKIHGHYLSTGEIDFIREIIGMHWDRGRKFISKYLCEQFDWRQENGLLKDMACRSLLLRMEGEGLLTLPPRKNEANNHLRNRKTQTVLVDTRLLEGSLKTLMPITLSMVRWSKEEKLFNALISMHHYLGYHQIIGAHAKYMAFSQGRPLACIGWGAAAWRVACRDQFIGWNAEQRDTKRAYVVQNTRFLILPWVRIPHLASYLLALNVRRITLDWQSLYGHPVAILETFVDTTRFQGTCYRAANWIYVGDTKGRGKYDQYNRWSKPVKAVYVYPLRKDFRQILCNG